MFSDKYGLTDAVLNGTKTMTRRLVTMTLHQQQEDGSMREIQPDNMFLKDGELYCQLDTMAFKVPLKNQPRYKLNEVVAVAQSYHSILHEMVTNDYINPIYDPFRSKKPDFEEEKGWTNKMFVLPSFMPHQIRITDIRVERLQDISDEDCLKEGIIQSVDGVNMFTFDGWIKKGYQQYSYTSPREAFAPFIDKITGKGTWEKNPWVIVYTFELVQ